MAEEKLILVEFVSKDNLEQVLDFILLDGLLQFIKEALFTLSYGRLPLIFLIF